MKRKACEVCDNCDLVVYFPHVSHSDIVTLGRFVTIVTLLCLFHVRFETIL